jgi:plastocyanin
MRKETSAMFKQPALLLSAAALALGVAACGGSSSSSSAGGSTGTSAATSAAAGTSASSGTGTSASGTGTSAGAGTGTSASATSSAAAAGGGSSALSIAANSSGSLSYDKKTLAAKAGKVTITMTNMAPVGHNITIQQGTSGAVLGSTPTFNGGTKSVSLNLKAGTYTFYCSVPGHRAGGMVGTLTVS